MKNPVPLKVTLYGMDERAAQMFTMFLAGPARGCCVVVPEGQQEAVVVDLDGVGAERLWLDVRRRFSGPALVLSVRERQLRHSIWVPKPIRADQLISAVERVRTELNTLAALHRAETVAENTTATRRDEAQNDIQKITTAQKVPIQTPAVQRVDQKTAGDVAHAAELTMQERRVHECCGDLADEVYRDPSRRTELFYDPDETLLGVMREAMHMAKTAGTPALIEGLGHPLILCPDQKRLFSEMREQYLRALCIRLRHQSSMLVRTIPLEEVPTTASVDPRLQRLDATLWKVALWTARGRVPIGTSLDAPVSLRAWPNLTRLLLVPGAMQIAALWAKQPTGLMATAERLGLPYRYVFSFFTACQVHDLVDQVVITPTHTTPSGSAAQVVSEERRGLFRRMLNKLGFG